MNIALKREEAAAYRLRGLYEAYGYSQYKMSKFEEYDLYVQNKSFLVSDHIITFTDTSGKLMALKPDVTLSIVKNSRDGDGLRKVHYEESVYRVSRSSDSYKEITQVGLECLGEIDAYRKAEVLTLAVKSLEEISPEYILEVSHLGIIAGVLDAMGAEGALRQELIACLGEKNAHGIAAACRDAGVDAAELLNLLSLSGSAETVLAALSNTAAAPFVEEFSQILSAVPGENVRVDFSLVGDMTYYNGIVFRGYISGIPTSILSGGQYDRLMQKMGRTSGAIGFAVYLDLLEQLQEPAPDFDVDAVLLYDDTVSLKALSDAVAALTAEGQRVTALRSVPEKLRYAKLLKLTESGVQTLENNA